MEAAEPEPEPEGSSHHMYIVLLRTDWLKSEDNIRSRFYGENDTREAFFMHRLIVYSKIYTVGVENNGGVMR